MVDLFTICTSSKPFPTQTYFIFSLFNCKEKSSLTIPEILGNRPKSLRRAQESISTVDKKGRNVDNICFRTIGAHRRCDSRAEPVIKVCFTWPAAWGAHRRGSATCKHNTVCKKPPSVRTLSQPICLIKGNSTENKDGPVELASLGCTYSSFHPMQKKTLDKKCKKKPHTSGQLSQERKYILFCQTLHLSQSLVTIFRCFQFPLHLYVPLWTKTHLAAGWRETASRVSNCSFPSVSPLLTHSQPTAATSLLLLKTQDRMSCSFSHLDCARPPVSSLLCLHLSLFVVCTHFNLGRFPHL